MREQIINVLKAESPFGYALHEILLDKKGNPVDYKYLDVNSTFLELTGLTENNIIGARVTSIFKGIENDSFDWIGFFGDVAINQTKKECEQYSQVLNRWYKVTAICPVKYKFIALFTDITEEKNHKSKNTLILELSKNLLKDQREDLKFEDITNNILKLSEAKYAVFNLFSTNQETVTNKATCGNTKTINKALSLIGVSLKDKKWQVSEKRKFALKDETIIKFNNLADLAEDVIPSSVCHAISKITDTGRIYEVIIRHSKNILGSFMLFYSSKDDMTNQDQIMTYINIVGLAINKWQADKKLQIQNKHLSHIIESTNTGTWEWNVQTGKTIFNDRWADIIGYTLEELEPVSINTWLEIVHPDDLKICEDNLQKHFDGESEFYEAELRIRHKDGHWVWIYDKGKLISVSKDGKPKWMFGTHQDITERVNFERELMNAKEKAEESDRLKSAFLANMSHEIRTPMNAILGFASFLYDDELHRDEIKRYTEYIINSGDLLLELINDIIDISKIDAGEVRIAISPVDLNDELVELYELFKLNVKLKTKLDNLSFNYHLPDSTVIVNTDKTRLKQILINLLGNAIKFTSEGSIDFGYEAKGDGKIRFYVKDTGIGISEKDQAYIFDRFRQATSSTEAVYGGTGLGLAIAKAFVELLKGDIWFESEPEKGSKFFFTIPE